MMKVLSLQIIFLKTNSYTMGIRGKSFNRSEIHFKLAPRRHLPLSMRDKFGINAIDRIRIKQTMAYFIAIKQLSRKIIKSNLREYRRLKTILKKLVLVFIRILAVDHSDDLEKKRKEQTKRKTIRDFEREAESFSEIFRFQSGDQLRELLLGFQFPIGVIRIKGSKFTAEEILLISLIRLSWPLRWSDVRRYFPDRSRQELQIAFYWFLDFMIDNWGYLITNNREYWLPFLQESAEAIRTKLATLPNEENRLFFDAAGTVTGFAIAMFIDNTILAMCRPGGGPTTDGEQALRISKLMQQAFWTGWKKLHGLKWQTTILANGMDFEVWGPASVRRNDNFTLHRSRIEQKLEDLQIDCPLKFRVHGDSAYSVTDYLVSGGGKGMAAVRETIEWTYKDLKTTWKYCDYKYALKIRNQPLGKIFFVCMLLRNAHVTLNGNQAGAYFICHPPSLNHWLSQGPKARPLPQEIFNA
jgi:hypothetical protein